MEDGTNKIKLATWNLCLGLANKKDLSSRIKGNAEANNNQL